MSKVPPHKTSASTAANQPITTAPGPAGRRVTLKINSKSLNGADIRD